MVYAVATCRALLALVFAASVLGKVRSRTAFRELVASVRRMRPAPVRHSKQVAVAVIVAEGAIPLTLAVPVTAMAGFALAAAILAVFVVAIAATVRGGAAVPCRCFGASTTPLGLRHIVRNALLAAVAMAGAVGTPTADAAVHPMGAKVAVLALLVTQLDALIDLFAGPAIARAK